MKNRLALCAFLLTLLALPAWAGYTNYITTPSLMPTHLTDRKPICWVYNSDIVDSLEGQ